MISHRDLLARAAAPELLEACREFVAALEATKFDVFIGTPAELERLTDARRRALRAIAMAEPVRAFDILKSESTGDGR